MVGGMTEVGTVEAFGSSIVN